jgi:iron complex outermembrane receptor protein
MHRISDRVRFSSTSFILLFTFWCAEADAQMLVHFDLPAQSLARSLKAIGTATNTDVGFSASQVAGLLAPPLKANLTVDGALTRVLVGTGLRPKHLDDHTIVIAATETFAADSQERKLLWAKAPSAAEPGDQIVPSQAGAAASSTDNPASSNTEKKDLEEIVVTGTHIHGADNKINPIIVIDQAQIERSGFSSTSDLFRSLPQNFQSPGASEDGVFTRASSTQFNNEFATGIDLRGLGPSSTLVLLNGHRLAPSATGSFVDVSQIPLSAIDRVEILTDGSSAIYGSDAVGGVVNVILKKDYQGADTSARYGASTSGGRDEVLASQTLGSNWSSGNAVGTLQFQKQGALPAADRAFASSLSEPNDLFPSNRSYGGTLDGRQALTDRLEFYGDVLLSKREYASNRSSPQPPLGIYDLTTSGNTQSINISPSLRYSLSPKWTIQLNGLYGYQKSITNEYEAITGFVFTDVNLGTNSRFTEKSIDLVSDGHLGSTAAGEITVALGASYRNETLSNVITQFSGGTETTTPRTDDRHVTAEFIELHLPIVGAANGVPLVQALELSAALRRDKYSDFGSTTNPHFGLRWAPLADISLRASYGKSFRAPNASEEIQENIPPYIFSYQALNPAGPGMVPVLVLCCSKRLEPERARTWNFGLEYKPADLQGFTAALDYYDIRYSNRIVTPPISPGILQQPAIYGSLISPVASDAAAQALVDSITAGGGQFFDEIGTGVAGVRYLYDIRQQNAAVVRQSGIDLTSKYVMAFGAHTLTSQINVAFTDKIDTQFAEGAAFANQVNAFGSPSKWRARVDSTWGGTAYAISGALNVVGSYVDTSAVGNPPIASWTTIDFNATLNADAFFPSRGWRGVSFSVIMLNALNRDPPFVSNVAQYPVGYDSANANPVGRFIAVALRKKW